MQALVPVPNHQPPTAICLPPRSPRPQNGYKVDDNQELLALGAANIFGSAFGAYPASGSLSRTALVASVGGKHQTQLHGVVTAVLILLVLSVATTSMRNLPKCVLASLVFMAIKNLVNLGDGT